MRAREYHPPPDSGIPHPMEILETADEHPLVADNDDPGESDERESAEGKGIKAASISGQRC